MRRVSAVSAARSSGGEVRQRAGQLEGRLPAPVGGSAADLLEVVAGASPLERHEVEDQEDADGRSDDEQRQQEEPGDQPARAAGFFGGIVVVRIAGDAGSRGGSVTGSGGISSPG